jgi:peptidoglycan pentaglycine glycine transferase (the first glycine)
VTGTGITKPPNGLASGADAWDSAVERMGGDLLQCWNWGEFKSHYGWSVDRVISPAGSLAQILFRHFGPLTLAYLPRGPVLAPGADDDLELLKEIDDACARKRAISLIIEPAHPLPDTWRNHGVGLIPAQQTVQSPRTMLVDLTLDDETLVRQMRKDTRYNISYALRNGTSADHEEPTPEALDEFFAMLSDTATRSDFGIHNREYYADFMRLFRDKATLIFARTDGVTTAGLIACRNGIYARSMYAGTRPDQRSRGDAALLRFAAMRWARAHGCTTYDLGGLAPVDPAMIDDSPEHPRADAVNRMKGVETFKTGFGGEVFTFPHTMERPYHPRMMNLARRFQRLAPRHAD